MVPPGGLTDKSSLLATEANSGCDLDNTRFPEVLNYGDSTSIQWLSQLNDCDRRTMLIHAEGAAVSSGDLNLPISNRFATRLIPLPLRYVEVPRKMLQLAGLQGTGGVLAEVLDPTNLQQMGQDTGVILSSETVKIPIHPTTLEQHPLIQWFIDQKYPMMTYQNGDSQAGPTTITTMSRSLWYLPQNRATTIKMGSDYINGRYSPNKLTDVGRDIKDLQDILENTSIPDLISTLDVEYLVETKALTLTAINSPDALPYTVSLRDFSRLLQDKHRIYIPLALLENRVSAAKSCDGWYLIPYGFKKSIRIQKNQLESMLYKLNQTLARVIAIHHANGYMPIDFHGQNLLVGIPLNPEVSARLVIRDVADIYPFIFDKTERSTWGGIKKVKAKGLSLPNLDLDQAVAYKDQMKQLGFKLKDQVWDRVPSQYTIRDIARQYYEYNQSFFWSQVGEFRQKKCSQVRPHRATQCVLRAQAFAGSRGVAKPAPMSVLKN